MYNMNKNKPNIPKHFKISLVRYGKSHYLSFKAVSNEETESLLKTIRSLLPFYHENLKDVRCKLRPCYYIVTISSGVVERPLEIGKMAS